MTEIGAYEAKTHLPKLLERVANGERFVITKHGRPVAELVPVVARDISRIRSAISEARSIRAGLAKRGMRLRNLLESAEGVRDIAHEGHRY